MFDRALIVGLANKHYYHSERDMYEHEREMSLQLVNYGRLLDVAGGFTTHNWQEVYRAAIRLWKMLLEFIATIDIAWDKDELGI